MHKMINVETELTKQVNKSIEKIKSTEWVCETCGCPEIQQQSWTYINSDELADYIDGYFYCEWCNSDDIAVIDKKEFNEVKEKKNDEK